MGSAASGGHEASAAPVSGGKFRSFGAFTIGEKNFEKSRGGISAFAEFFAVNLINSIKLIVYK